MRKADAQPSVNVLVRANPVVRYTINSTVNGHVHPFLGIALALRARGHRVTFLLNEYFGPLARSLGFESVPLGDVTPLVLLR